jgi:hypothetical protein
MQSSVRGIRGCVQSSRVLRSSSSNYVCAQCRQGPLAPAQSIQRSMRTNVSQRYASTDSNTKVPFTEKLRRKLWNTDTPPGLEDPYGGKSILERRAEARKRAARGGSTETTVDSTKLTEPTESTTEAAAPLTTPPVPTEGYVPATTWDGLESIGGASGWWESDWDRENQFQGYVSTCQF